MRNPKGESKDGALAPQKDDRASLPIADDIGLPVGDLERYVNDLAQTLRRLVGQRSVALFDWPNYANAGDHFIWLGEKVLFKDRLGCRVVYECSLNQLDLLRVARLPPETVLVMHGGGNLGDLYDHHQRFREAIVAAFPDRRIVFMPQTVHFADRERMQQSARRMTLHPDLHVMARDHESLVTLRSQMGLSNTYLHIDSAFALQPIVSALIAAFAAAPDRDAVYLLRRDVEAARTVPPEEGSLRVDWGRTDDLAPFAVDAPDPKSIDLARDIIDGAFDLGSWRQLCAAIRLFGQGRKIVTDRLHGHILAIMMRKEHELHDNSYGKNSAFFRTWTRASPLTTFVGSAPGLPNRASSSTRVPHPAPTPSTREAPPERKRLGIIVPYRDRPEHLKRFLPHLISFLRRDLIAKNVDVRILISEQQDDLPFNRGTLLNAGFLALEGLVDYICLHDVDYLPMWADYSYADMPTRIIWWGMDTRPIRVNQQSRRTTAPRIGLGAVTLFSTAHFRLVNGFSNRFFGWGFEDKDLAERCRLHALSVKQRDGTFIPLDHDNAGFLDDGSKSPAWLENERRFAENQKVYQSQATPQDGLSDFSGRMDPIEELTYTGLDDAEQYAVMRQRVSVDNRSVSDPPNRTMQAGASLPALPSGNSAIVAPRESGEAVAPAAASVRSRRQKICLCMIVKDEAPAILRCLESVRPIIDYWIIVDTGSTDGTQDVIREYFGDFPGELHQQQWVDFAYNRSAALVLARDHGDYSLIIDADDVLELPPGFAMPHLSADSYTVEIRNKERLYWRPQIVRNAIPWRYEGVLHEFLSCVGKNGRRMFAENRSQKRLPGARIRMSESGARRRSSSTERFGRDVMVLEHALQTEADPFLVSRYTFYLAQSHLDSGDQKKALQAYQERSTLGGWEQEVFISLYRSANIKAALGCDEDDVIETYLSAHGVVKNRAEPLHGAARFCRIKERFQDGYGFAKRALPIRLPGDGLFLEEWIYAYGVLDEYAVNAYWIGNYEESLKACRKILSLRNIPEGFRKRVQANADLAAKKL